LASAICGDEQGVSSITVSEDEIITSTIPEDLQEVVSQLNDYFKGKNRF
jgi:methylated-DNA-[protein]-cysteine S-methyltransferase